MTHLIEALAFVGAALAAAFAAGRAAWILQHPSEQMQPSRQRAYITNAGSAPSCPPSSAPKPRADRLIDPAGDSIILPIATRRPPTTGSSSSSSHGKSQIGIGMAELSLASSRLTRSTPVDVVVIRVTTCKPGQALPSNHLSITEYCIADADPAKEPGQLVSALSATLAGEVADRVWVRLPQSVATSLEAAPATLASSVQSAEDGYHEIVVGQPIDLLGSAAGIPQGPLTVIHAIGVNVALPGDENIDHVKLGIQLTGVVLGLTLGSPHLFTASLNSLLRDELKDAVQEVISKVLAPSDVSDNRAERGLITEGGVRGEPRQPQARIETGPGLVPAHQLNGSRGGGLSRNPYEVFGGSPNPVGETKRQSRNQRSNGPQAGR